MERGGRLSALLASFSLLPWLVLITGLQSTPAIAWARAPLEAPKLSLSPSHLVFVRGERVKLNCTIPEGKQAQSFTFHEGKTEWHSWNGKKVEKKQNESTLEIPITHSDSWKFFYCYYTLQSRSSPWSNYVEFDVIEPPQAPDLSLRPQNPVYLQGERVTLTCSTPQGKKTTGYTFYQETGDQVLETLLRGQNWRKFTVEENTAGRYSCVYLIEESRREIRSLRSNTVSVVRIEHPQAPTLSLQPQHPVYIQGEDVTLNCSAPTAPSLAEYTFYREQEHFFFRMQQPKSHRNTLALDGNTEGQFRCQYQFRVSGRAFQSPRSISVFVTRTESPQPPTVSLHPQHPVYIQGEEITLICSAPRKDVTGYTFYQEIGGQVLEVLSGNHHATLRVREESTRKYHCIYWIQVSGRKIQSQGSNSVYVSRTDPLPPPELKVDPLSGAVNEGEPLLITCLTNRRNMEKRFHFYKDGVEMDSSNEGSLRSISGDPSPNATLRIPQANSSYGGEFACSFEENLSSRWVFSPWSQKVNVTVQAQVSSVRALGYSCLTLLFTVMVSLACYYRWRRKWASKVEKQFPPQRNEEATGCLERLEPQPAQTEARLRRPIAVEEEGESYSEIQFPPTQRTNSVEEEGESYSEIQFPPTQRTNSVEEERVSYSEIQFCLDSLKAMEEDSALYSNLQCQASHGLKPVEKDQVLYSAIRFKPIHGVAK